MLRILLAASLIYCTTLAATAQSTEAITAPPPPRPRAHKSTSDWPDPAPAEKLPYRTLDIVTINEPNVRQHCRVHDVEAQTITCRNHRHQADTIYHRDDIVALIEPPAHENLISFMEAAGIVGATLAASFFVPLAGSIILRIITGFLFFGAWYATGTAYDELAAIGYSDHNDDILLYQRPDTTLTIHLR